MIAKFYYETDEAVKQQKLAELKKEKFPFVLDKLEAAAKENNGYLTLGRVCNNLLQANYFLTNVFSYSRINS